MIKSIRQNILKPICATNIPFNFLWSLHIIAGRSVKNKNL